MILVTRRPAHICRRSPTSSDASEKARARREAVRCLKRYLARNLYRLLENGAPLPT